MNKELFFSGYIDRIAEKFSLPKPLAFEILAIAAILDLSFDEVYDGVSTLENRSGSHDGGFDGLYLEEDDGDNTLHVFQVKSAPTVGDNELSKFISDYRNLFVDGNTLALPLNKKVRSVFDTYQQWTQSGRVINVRLYFIFKGDKTKQNEALLNRHANNTENLLIFDSNDLYQQIDNLVAERKKRKPVAFSFKAEKSNISFRNDPQALISFSIKNVKAVNFRLSALELCQLLDYEQVVNKRIDALFSDNVRDFLRYNKTNKNIRDTLLSHDAEYFPFLNNGITLIAERLKLPNDMQAGVYPLEVLNPVIVNGLQTTHVIYDIYRDSPNALIGVYVVVRLYETTDADLIDKITEATNTQSPINFRDKISTRRFNDYAKEVFANAGIAYLSKRGETFYDPMSITLQKAVHSETVLKFWYATFYEQPVKAKSAKSKVLEELFDATNNPKNDLNRLFDGGRDSPVYQQLLEAFWIYEFVVAQRQAQNDQADFVLFADELMAYGIYKLRDKSAGFAKEHLESAYAMVFDAILNSIERQKINLASSKATYAHERYFKTYKSQFDLIEALGLSDTFSDPALLALQLANLI
ncbi:MAG: AIPR family protein [Methylococcaceae bacterium]|nr:AIPR family protein [Methylococcaceae bacterium]